MGQITFTIAQDATTSDAHDLRGRSIVRIDFPAMTGTAVTMTEQDGAGNYVAVYDDASTAISLTVAASARVVHLNPGKTVGMGPVKLVSNGTEAAARTIYVYTEDYTS